VEPPNKKIGDKDNMEKNDDIFKGCGIEIELPKEDDFLKIKETLTRIGVASKKTNTLYQSCHILHKKGRYIILHFKELFDLDGKECNISENDIGRRNMICRLLEEWGLLKIVDDLDEREDPFVPVSQINIISYKDKDKWNLSSKYNIGKHKLI